MRKMSPKWHRRGPVAATLVFLILIPGRTQTRNVAPQPLGRLVDVGGYRVHVYCVGNGKPTVVITGAGYSFDWGLVQPEVAKFTRVCAYDHSGIAWSDPGPTDSCSIRVREIHSALRNAEITGPYVLVGHSLGALVSRLYASKYPDEVAGMVIVDHAGMVIVDHMGRTTVESLGVRNTDVPPAFPPTAPKTRAELDLDFQKLPARDYQPHLWANSLPGHSNAVERNFAMVPECASEVEAASRNQITPLEDKPLIVLTHATETKLTSLSLNSKQVLAENSGHYIMVDRPDLVITAIHEVVLAAQNHTKVKN